MNRSAKAERIGAILDELYPVVVPPLAAASPFELLVAVVLSVQCTDERVNKVTPTLFALAPDAGAMVALGRERVLELVRSCGLGPAKAKNIVALSELLIERHAGGVPSSFAELEALPGVGHKVASVIMGQSFGQPAFPIDTHIDRLAHRWGLSHARNVVGTERDLKRLFAPERWHDRHLQMIFFGREHCPARGHDFDACRICSWAASQAARRREAAAAKARRARTSAQGEA